MTGSNQVSNVVSSVVTPVALSGVKTPLLNQFEGAAAAYSLRRLKSWDDGSRVVRVRRESDNTERDFSSVEVSDGTMARWVNEQPTLPLDLRELDTNTGERDGALIEAAAAYSLRKLKEDFTGDVVEVRRNVDGETEGFTADEVTDGTLESFVEGWEEVTQLVDNSNYEADNLNFTYVDSRNFTFDFSGNNGFDYDLLAFSLFKVGKHRVTFDLTVNEGTDADTLTDSKFKNKIAARDGDGDTFYTANTYQLQEGFNDITLTSKDNLKDASPKMFFQASYNVDKTFNITISNLKVYESTVNELPLDQATGAAAAYSLRNLKASGTDVTTSGDTAGDTTGKYVVQVRRSSDDAVKSFTASEVADGTLEDWVNADVGLTEDTISAGNNYSKSSGTGTVLSSDTLGFTASGASSLVVTKGGFPQDFVVPAESKLKITYNASGLTGSARILPRQASTGSSGGSPIVLSNGTGNTGTITTTLETNLLIFDGVSGSDVSLEITSLEIIEADGHVRTWYDQSGSDNHAVQTTPANQPKIVDGGNLLEDGIDFDNTDDYLTTSNQFSFGSGARSIFAICAPDTIGANADAILQLNVQGTSSGTGWMLTPEVAIRTNTTTWISSSPATLSQDNLISHIYTGGNLHSGLSMYLNGAEVTRTSGNDGSINTATSEIRIGAGYNGNQPFDGAISEIIIYDSDQSTKRRAIEENIANHYDITLAAFSRDGTVSTWYDQSGSTPANDATQTDPTKQPKVVEGGTLNSDGIYFDGTDNELNSPSIDFGDNPNTVFTLVKSNDLASNSFFLSLGGFSNLMWQENTGTRKIYAGANLTGGTMSSNQELWSAFFDNPNDTGTLHVNGTQDASGNIGTAVVGTAPVKIGAIGGSSPHNGWLKEIIIYNSDQSDNRTAIEANIGETYGITGIPAANDTVNGYVQTWYDQSGSGNDAEQSAASSQPKIVGEVTSGQPHAFLGALVFEGSQQFQTITLTSSAQPNSIFSVSNTSVAGQTRGIYGTNANQASYYRSSNKHAIYSSGTGAGTLEGSAYVVDTDYLRFDLFNGANSVLGVNGTTTSGTTGDAVLNRLDIGDASLGGVNPLNGSIKELVLYTDDQSSNRTAIESNIANHYPSITLS